MKTLIKNGLLIDPANRVQAKLNLLIEDGRVAAVTAGCPEADRVVDAAGLVVAPGFIALHMHEDPVDGQGHLVKNERAIFSCMARMGVTTVLAGQCGLNKHDPAAYLDLVDREGAAVNVALLAGHEWFREAIGHTDRYTHLTDAELDALVQAMAPALKAGCFGISYGIRYVPGIDERELLATAALCRPTRGMIAAHMRDDAAAVFDAARELMDAGKALDLPVQISHIGSMAGYGQMEEFLRLVDEYRMNGLDVACDCYPYYAFSTTIGATTYDEGWMERYGCDYSAVELCEGPYKGQRCTKETFEEMRRVMPEAITVGHVMQGEDVDMAYRHPAVMLASDGIMDDGQGHPRAAGSFPRLIAEFVRSGKLSLYDAIDRMTAMPAARMGLADRGRLSGGAVADVVLFDPDTVKDNATFKEPTLAPGGIHSVWIGGEPAVREGVLLRDDLGRAVRCL